jgi:ribosomal subunit interface protein
MNIKILFRGMEQSDAIEKYTSKVLKKINKFLDEEHQTIYFDLVFQADRDLTHYNVELRLRGEDLNVMVAREGRDLLREIDHVVKVMIKELRKRKDKALNK